MHILLKNLLLESAVTDNPNFKKWFGDSKIVDNTGKPLKMYHGAKSDIGPVFQMYRGMLGTGAYFTSNPSEAEEYTSNAVWKTKPNIVPVYLCISNPFIVYDKYTKVPTDILNKGYDGVVLKNQTDSIAWGVVTNPTQVKSIYNKGNFDSNNPDISK